MEPFLFIFLDIPEKLISCPHCPNKYVSEDELKLHQGVAHIAKNLRLKRVLPCDICEELFWRDSGLERHKRRVHRVNLVVCEVCGLGIKQKLRFSPFSFKF